MKNFTVEKKEKKSLDHKIGVCLGYFIVWVLVVGVIYSGISMSKYMFGVYDLEDRVEHLEHLLMEDNNAQKP